MAIGIALILGLFTGLAALAGLTAQPRLHVHRLSRRQPGLRDPRGSAVLAWRNAGYLGLDRFALNAEWRGRHLPGFTGRAAHRANPAPGARPLSESARGSKSPNHGHQSERAMP